MTLPAIMIGLPITGAGGGSGDSTQKFSANLRTNPTLSQGTLQLACQRADPTNRIRSLGDYEGLTRYAVANEAVWEGYRRVENLYPTATDAPTSQTVTIPVLVLPNAQRSFVISFTGSGSVSWTGTTSGSPLAGIDASTRVGTVALTPNAASIVFTLAGDVRFIQVEETTGQVLNTAPSEYVSRGTLAAPYHGPGVDGVQYFTTTNGNSLSVKTVVDGTGSTLSTIRGLSGFPQQKQLILDTEDFTTGNWTNVGSPTNTANAKACGLVSLTNIEDTGGAELQGITQTFSGFLSSTQTNGANFRFGKSSSNATSQACYRVYDAVVGAGTGDRIKMMIEWPGSVATVTNTLANGVNAVPSPTITASITVPVGTALLVACVAYSTQTTNTKRTITAQWNGAENLTSVPGADGWTGATGDSGGCDILYLVNPTAATANLVATLSANADRAWLSYTCWTGVDTTLPMQFMQQTVGSIWLGTSAGNSIPVTMNQGDVSIDCMFSGFVAGPPTGNSTLIYVNQPLRSGGAQYNTNPQWLQKWRLLKNGTNFETLCIIKAARSSPGAGSTPYITPLTGNWDAIIALGNNTFEFSGRTTTVTLANNHTMDFYPATDSSLAVGNTGAMLFGAPNIQSNSATYGIPSPYIPTGSAAIIRPYDSYTADMTGWANQAAGTMVSEVEYTAYTVSYSFQLYCDTNERMQLLRRGQSGDTSLGVINEAARHGGAEQVQINNNISVANYVVCRQVYAYELNNFGCCIDGGTVQTDSLFTPPNAGAANNKLMGLGGSPLIGGQTDCNLSGYVRELIYYNVRKSDAVLPTL